MPKKISKKKILILTEERGGKGHIMPALALAEAFEDYYRSNYQIKILSIDKYLVLKFGAFLHWTYETVTRHAAPLYRIISPISDSRLFMYGVNYVMYISKKSKLIRLYQKERPDIVISDYHVWDFASTRAFRKYSPDKLYINVVTDTLYPHYSWIIGRADYHIVAETKTKQMFEKRGVESKKILPLGIPVRKQFSELTKLTPIKYRKKAYILFLPTSNKISNIEKSINGFLNKADIKLEVILGRNQSVLSHLQKKYSSAKNIILNGWIDNIAEHMYRSHIIITKAGGSTTTECLALKKPIIVNHVIGGQEKGNLALIKQYNIGEVCTRPEQLYETCQKILHRYDFYLKGFEKISKSNSAEQIVQTIHKLLN